MTAFPASLWRTSSRTNDTGHCVEVALTAEAVGVRDTKNRSGGTLVLAPETWAAFVGRLKDGGCDRA
ncbi:MULTISPECIES: DUF397 domain-containing protein [unclassified Actinopolyspora]|uniref:DUF397 domain-containing protein n=1 Tax=unclassified Actinopolyspora TaxID=2639451 RepID=UPI0013F63FAC|nr:MULTISPECIES: DUF397 domain-containing protein [unclassified Actinopolyspora]NHD16342.1 DUF397 domain-containing protein [Actinopolyspora sp. BKK2]NHE75795.1 DUF397 domain-containing protein [Actinopolyspora sp. BKK1]